MSEPDSINEFVLVGEWGFHRIEGPFDVQKDGTLWTIVIPTEDDYYGKPRKSTIDTLHHSEEKASVLISDGSAVGGGIVDTVFEPEGEGELHIMVDQYAIG